MTADILLQLHNTTQMLNFFAAIRRHLRDGTFGEYRRFMDPSCCELPLS
jgi:queuine/archaeosine tRNA-ribosyltransferase